MNRLIVTFVIGHLPWAKDILPSLRAYGSKSGADFLEVKWFPEKDKHYHGNPNWSCVEFLKNFARQDYYQEVLMLDCDVVILPSCPNLFNLPGDLVCSPDQAWRTKDERYTAWLGRNYPQHPTLQEGGPYFNAGVLLFRLDAVRRMDLEGPYPNDYADDQDFLNMQVERAGLNVHWLGDEFNQRRVGNHLQAIQDNHILHFVGRNKEHIGPITKILDQ